MVQGVHFPSAMGMNIAIAISISTRIIYSSNVKLTRLRSQSASLTKQR